MKKYFNFILFSLLTISCADNVTVTIVKEPSTVVGRVYPIDAEATVGLYQGVVILTNEGQTDPDGTFRIDSVKAGNYLLKASALGFGTYVIKDVEVGEGEARDIGEIILSTLPWPFFKLNIDLEDTTLSVDGWISFDSREELDEETLQKAASVTPSPSNLQIGYQYYPQYNNDPPLVYFSANWDYRTKYTVILDTSLKTLLGVPIEFPLVQRFTTEPFRVTYINVPAFDSPGSNVRFDLNSNVDQSEIDNNVRSNPDVLYRIWGSSGNRRSTWYIDPFSRWPTGDTYITLDGDLMEQGGHTIGKDTTFKVTMDFNEVEFSNPFNGDTTVSYTSDIYVEFSASINASDVTLYNYVSISPQIQFTLHETYYDYGLLFDLNSSLVRGTTYTVKIDSLLPDKWGNPLKNSYEFWFKVQ